MDEIFLRIGGLEFEGWENIRVRRSLFEAASQFNIQVSSNPVNDLQTIDITPGNPVTIYLDSDIVLTGYVDKVETQYSGTHHTMNITGRSKTQDVVDSSVDHSTGNFKNRSALQLARTFASPYGIEIVDLVNNATPIDYFEIDPGETAFSAIQRAAELRGMLVSDNEEGNLVFSKPQQLKSTTILQSVRGRKNNILDGNVRFDNSDRYKVIIVRGQKKGNDNDWGESANQVQGQATDPEISRQRTLVLQPPGNSTSTDCERFAKFEVTARAVRGFEAQYTVQGWRQKDGTLWQSNMLILVNDEFGNINEELIVVAIEYSKAEGTGTLTRLTLTHPDLLVPEPISNETNQELSKPKNTKERWEGR